MGEHEQVPDISTVQNSHEDDVPLARGLSTRLLILTILFVMIAEVLIFLPSVANFRLRWLEERLGSAAAASIILAADSYAELPKSVRDDVLMTIGAKAVAIREEGVSRLLAMDDMPIAVDQKVDVNTTEPFKSMGMALYTLFAGGDQIIRVYGSVGDSSKVFELIIPDTELRAAMLIYSRNVAFLSLLISLITATLVFYSINRFMIRPIRAMTRSMLLFGEAPDDPVRVIQPSGRRDELGVAERELAEMQSHLQKTLGEQKHLADLGLAVSKINHDMRNILASAQLMSDRLAVTERSVGSVFRTETGPHNRPGGFLYRRSPRLWAHPGGPAVAPSLAFGQAGERGARHTRFDVVERD